MLASKFADPEGLPTSPTIGKRSTRNNASFDAKEIERSETENYNRRSVPNEEKISEFPSSGTLATSENLKAERSAQSNGIDSDEIVATVKLPTKESDLRNTIIANGKDSSLVVPRWENQPGLDDISRNPTQSFSPPIHGLGPNVGSKGQDLPKTPSPELISSSASLKPAPALRRLRSSKGKTCTIRIPTNYHKTYSGYGLPMTTQEVEERIKSFEKEGYDVQGFSLQTNDDTTATDHEDVQGRKPFPDPDEQRAEFAQRQFDVSIPNKKEWDDHVKHLNEEKLRKLGVSFGDEPALPPANLPPRPILSRNATSPYPPLPFSPPVPGSSAGSQHGWQNYLPFSAPFSPAASTNNTSTGQIMSPAPQFGPPVLGHQSKPSSFGFSFPSNQSLPLQQAWSHQQIPQESPQGSESQAASFVFGRQTPVSIRPSPVNEEANPHSSIEKNSEPKTEPELDWSKIGRQRSLAAEQEIVLDSDGQLATEETQPNSDLLEGQYGNLASPKPQGHRHNVSAHLEREVENAEYYPGEYVNGPAALAKDRQVQSPFRPSNSDASILQGGTFRNHQSMPSQASNASSSQLNVAAKEFIFNPGKSQSGNALVSKETFMPAASMKSAKPADATSTVSFATAHSHQGSVSLSHLNVAAPEFKPPAQKNFAFSSSWFNFSRKPEEAPKSDQSQTAAASQLNAIAPSKEFSIFGNLADIIKPSKKSKAVAIINPKDISHSSEDEASDQEDESGRITQSKARNKKSRVGVDDGDEVPRFAEPTPEPEFVPTPQVPIPVSTPASMLAPATPAALEKESREDEHPKPDGSNPVQQPSKESPEEVLKPLKIEYDPDVSGNLSDDSNVPWHGIDGDKHISQPRDIANLSVDRLLAASPAASSGVEEATSRRSSAFYPTQPDQQQNMPYLNGGNDGRDLLLYPSINDAQDIAEYINNDNSDFGFEEGPEMKPLTPHKRDSHGSNSIMAEPPTAKRDLISLSPDSPQTQNDNRLIDDLHPRFAQHADKPRLSTSPVRRLNKMAEAPVSDWDDMLSSGEELKIPQQHHLTDAHMVGIVEGLLKRHLGPFERTLKELNQTVNQTSRQDFSKDARRPVSSYEKSNSDADDEDEPTRVLLPNKRDFKADRRLEQIKSAVTEAMHSTQAGGLGQIEQEVKFRKAAEQRADDLQRLLALTEKEIALYKEAAKGADEKLSTVEDEREDALRRYNIVEEELRSKTLDFTAETASLENTLDEYRNAQTRWREEIDSVKQSREGLEISIAELKRKAAEASQEMEELASSNKSLKEQFLTSSDQWDLERKEKQEQGQNSALQIRSLQAKLEESESIQERLRSDIDRMSTKEQEAIRANVMLEETRNSKANLETLVQRLNEKAVEHQTIVARYEREASEANENTIVEVQRTRRLLETDIEVANKRLDNVKADLETRLQMAKSELENVRKDHDSVRARYELYLNDSIASRKEALQEANENHSKRLREERERFDKALGEISDQHNAAIVRAHEEKQRSETHLGSQLKLSDAKVSHLTERIAHLEERLSVAQSAAQAAASAAQAAKSAKSTASVMGSTSVTRSIATPAHLEKISPQALRESIVVLQEQLQDREARIESLENKPHSTDQEGSDKLRERETEVTWLREILNVRIDDLTDLVNNLQLEKFDRGAARNAAIRIKANLQMAQQDRDGKPESGKNAPAVSSLPILNDIQNFASPKAAQLATAFGNWRRNPPSLAELRQRQVANNTPSKSGYARSDSPHAASAGARQTQSPSLFATNAAGGSSSSASKPTMNNPMAAAAMLNANKQQPHTDAQNFLSGLMTPPASNLRRTPSTGASRPKTTHPRTPNHSVSRTRRSSSPSGSPEKELGGSTSPLMRKGDYDLDAELGHRGLELDEDLDEQSQHHQQPPSKQSPKKGRATERNKTEETAEQTKLEPLGGLVTAD